LLVLNEYFLNIINQVNI